MINASRILIVDDVVDNIRVAMNILQEDKYEFSFAHDGKEALQLIADEPEAFDLVLLDIMMPGVNGFEVCNSMKQISTTADIPIIFLTAKTDIDSLAQAFELGGVDYIAKPFHASELLARVKTHMDLYQAKKLLKQHNLYLQSKTKHEKQRLLTELEDNQKEMIYVLSELMEATSDETGKHVKRISETSALMAMHHPALGGDDVETLYHASPMHDVGKMKTPSHILHKPGRLNDDEFIIMKDHAVHGYQLLSHSGRKFFKAAAIIAHEHHEKWDGSGYPRALKETDIHIYGRIVALADVFDALTHKRVYKEAWDMDEAVNYIIGQRGIHFDPELVDIFQAHLDEFITITKSR